MATITLTDTNSHSHEVRVVFDVLVVYHGRKSGRHRTPRLLDESEITEPVNRGTSGWLHALAPEHCPSGEQPLVACPRAFVVVEEFERPLP